MMTLIRLWIPLATLAILGCVSDEESSARRPGSLEIGPTPTAATSPGRDTVDLGLRLSVAQVRSPFGSFDFSNPTSEMETLQEGWSQRPWELEKGYAWGVGAGSRLTFFAPRSQEVSVRFRARAYDAEDDRPDQTIRFFLQGTEVDVVELWPFTRSYRIRLPARKIRAGINHLELRYRWSQAPAEVDPDSEDERPLAVKWEEIRLEGRLDGGRGDRAVEAPGGDLLLPPAHRIDYFLHLGPGDRLRLNGLEPQEAPGSPRLVVELEEEGKRDLRNVTIEPAGADRSLDVVLGLDTPGPVRLSLLTVNDAGWWDRIRGEPGGLRVLAPRVLRHQSPGVTRNEPRTRTLAESLPDRPNVFIYLIDTLRADHLGCYGYPRPISPEIDSFAGNAVLFRRAVAPSSWTRSSVASLLTGVHPRSHGAIGRDDALPEEARTLAELLQDAGYRTTAFITNGNVGARAGFAQGFDEFRHLEEEDTERIHRFSDELNEAFFDWLDSEPETSEPLFAYVHATDPHGPYTPPEPFRSRFASRVRDPQVGLMEPLQELTRGERVPTDSLRRDLLALYDAEIAFNDAQFGAFLDGLEARGLDRSSVVVLVSDHGEEFYDHGWWQHGKTLYREQIWVPLVVKLPREGAGGSVVEPVVGLVDVVPTLLELAGVDPPPLVQGESLLPLLSGGDVPGGPRRAFAHLDLDQRFGESVVTRDSHFVFHRNEHWTGPGLFDWSRDPEETRNLADERPVRV
ncbi:MAG: sulfatase, partial [Thermoanaerobaculia bacterium]|nr:sulfatase [Thermoanaerobaculia bacterium]